MAKPFEWDAGLFSINTVEFDRALHQLRRDHAAVLSDPSLFCELATRLKAEPGIPRREFDRRLRLIVDGVAGDDPGLLQAVAGHLRSASPEALNALRTLLPAEMRHVAISPRSGPAPSVTPPPVVIPAVASSGEPVRDATEPAELSKYRAVALVGTPGEHVRNEELLRGAKLSPLRMPSLDDFWEFAPTGLCGFVIGGSLWSQVPASEHRQIIQRICEFSTFLFVRICVDGISPDVAVTFLQQAVEARCGPLDGQRFCHGQDCDLSLADMSVLEGTARLLEAAGTADFFPLGLSESDAALLRLIAVDRRHPSSSLTIRRLGTRELVGGRSGARVFLLNDGSAQPFVAKMGSAEQLTSEVRRYQRWIANWEPNVTNPAFHAHLKSAAISYRLQASPDGAGTPAPTLEDRLEELRMAEWIEPIEKCTAIAADIDRAVARAVDRLVTLNSGSSGSGAGDEFWLHWPVQNLASRGVDFTVVNYDWESIGLSELIQKAVDCLEPSFNCAVVHGDIHGRNILLLDRLPAFIDFALSGPGHPLVDLVRLDAAVRAAAMRMLLDKRSMHDLYQAVYIDGASAEAVLGQYPTVEASPLAVLAVRTAAKVRTAALSVAQAHGLGLREFFAMHCVVSAHVLANRNLGSGIERLMLSVVGSRFLADQG